MSKPEYSSHAVQHWSRLNLHYDADGKPSYITGVVLTGLGYVHVYTQGWGDSFKYTRLDFIHKGREHSLRLDKRLTGRGIATVARRFVRDVIDGRV